MLVGVFSYDIKSWRFRGIIRVKSSDGWIDSVRWIYVGWMDWWVGFMWCDGWILMLFD